jgi:enoyl-CoA hydratase
MPLSYHTLSFALAEGIGHLEFSQPPSNEMTLEFFSEFRTVTERMSGLKEMKALVVSGKGRHFSSGAKLPELLHLAGQPAEQGSSETGIEKILEENNRSFLFLEEMKIPVISAIRGVCLGSALEMILFSHFRFCGEDAVFGLPESTFNLIPGIGGISRIYALAGTATSLEIALRGNTFPAEEALRLGLVDAILPRKEVVRMAVEFAKALPFNYRKEKSKLYIRRFFSDQPKKIQQN